MGCTGLFFQNSHTKLQLIYTYNLKILQYTDLNQVQEWLQVKYIWHFPSLPILWPLNNFSFLFLNPPPVDYLSTIIMKFPNVSRPWPKMPLSQNFPRLWPKMPLFPNFSRLAQMPLFPNFYRPVAQNVTFPKVSRPGKKRKMQSQFYQNSHNSELIW